MLSTLSRFIENDHIELTDEQAQQVRYPHEEGQVVTVRPPRNENVPDTVPDVVRGIRDSAADWTGLRNQSGVIAFEIHRWHPGEIQFQYRTPSAAVDRQLRSHLLEAVPGIRFEESGVSGLPVEAGTAVGGALITTMREDYYPLRTSFDHPPLNAVVGLLHPDAMKQSTIIIQVLCQPIAGQKLRRWLYRRLRQQQIDYLRQTKVRAWGESQPTRRDRKRAEQIASKTAQPLWRCSIRVLVIGVGEYTQARVHELTAGFNRFENPESGQSLIAKPMRHIRDRNVYGFVQAVADRRFGWYGRSFRAAPEEVGALLAVPDREQGNVTRG